ncbi:LysM peptidoglycan-binding domain-containing protein [Streptomonospora alba]|uniref:LysM peptidoglycan-binding domain-containing protein n=1 Tax=Streptomonospora alba TaxID=183763 RepID=UPI00069A5E7E|nr:LysM peptidoglycan-binding domain-containing protein [Streptomonospora alba]
MTWPDTPAPEGPDRRRRRARLSVVPAQAPSAAAPARGSESASAATTAMPGAHNGALFDWAEQLPEWSRAAAAPRTAHRSRTAYPAPESAAAARAAVPAFTAAAAPVLTAAVQVWNDRLTRRGRMVVGAAASVLATAVLASLVMAATTGGASASGAPAESAIREEAPSTVVVRDGDTLWEIAERVRPADDPRSTVHEIVRENGLGESELEPGQELVMPDF